MKENISKVIETLAQFMIIGSDVTDDGIKIKFDIKSEGKYRHFLDVKKVEWFIILKV